MTKRPFHHIVAIDKHRGIGKNGDLVWRLKQEMAYFKRITSETKDPNKKNVVIMGRVTWESIPTAYAPLTHRLNIVLSSKHLDLPEGATLFSSLENALHFCDYLYDKGDIETIFVMGGARLYTESIAHPNCQSLYITQLNQAFDCDAFYPAFEDTFTLEKQSDIQEEKDLSYQFQIWTRNTTLAPSDD